MKYDSGKKHVLTLILVLAALFIPGAAAQSATVTDADSNLTDSQIDVEFTEIPSEEEMVVESIGSEGEDNEEVTDFTSESGGTATASWRHNPFEANTNLSEDGWDYRLTSNDSDFEYDFQVAHGNMLLGLDTFEDNSINEDLWDIETDESDSECFDAKAQEQDESLRLFTNSDTATDQNSCIVNAELNSNATENNAVAFDFSTVDNTEDDGYARINVDGNNVNEFEQGRLLIYLDSGEIIVEQDDEVIESFTTEKSEVNPEFQVYGDFGDDGEVRIEEFSNIPVVTESSFEDITIFNPSEDELTFPDFIVNQDGTAGLEFSNDSSSWGSTPPDSGESLYYRNIDSGTLDSTAVDTSELFGGVNFTALEPRNESTFIIDDDEQITQDFYYEVLYTREDCSDYAGIQSTFRLYEQEDYENENFDDTIDESTYPDNMDEDDCEYFRDFAESVDNLGAGDYVWTFYFRDNDLGTEKTFENEFSLVEESDAPVDFDLQTPEMGEEYNLSEDGNLPFEYNVEVDNDGELDLVIPQYDDEVRYEEDVQEGNNSNRVNLELDENVDYEWWLEYTQPETTTGDDGTDDFEDGDYSSDPEWTNEGDTDMEIIDNDDVVNGDYSISKPDNSDTAEIRNDELGDVSSDDYPEYYNMSLRITDVSEVDLNAYNYQIQSGTDDGWTGEVDVDDDGIATYDYEESETIVHRDIDDIEDGDVYDVAIEPDYDGEQYDVYVDGEEVSTDINCENCDNEDLTGISVEFQEPRTVIADDLTYAQDTSSTQPERTFQSPQVEFFTLDIIGGEDDGDDDDDDGDDEPVFDLRQKYFDFMDDLLGIGEDTALFVAGVLIIMGITMFFFHFGGTPGGAIGIPVGIMVAGVLEIWPGWVVMSLLLIAAAILGKLFQGVLSD